MTTTTQPQFADQIRAERKRIGITQQDCDIILEVGRGNTASWEIGRSIPLLIAREGALARLRALGTMKRKGDRK